MGKRLGEYTKDLPKCMVPVGGTPLIRHMLGLLDQMGLKQIIIVTGYQKDELTGYIEGLSLRTPVIFISNDIYDRTNNIYSLLLTKDYLEQDDTLLLESDLVYEDAVLTDLVADPRETVAVVDRYADWMSGTCVTVDDEDGRIIRFVMGSEFSESEKGINIVRPVVDIVRYKNNRRPKRQPFYITGQFVLLISGDDNDLF